MRKHSAALRSEVGTFLRSRGKLRNASAFIFLLFAGCPLAFAHAILVRSVPADNAVVRTRQIEIALDYNSRIEATRCTVTLTDLAGKAFPLQMQRSTRPSELKALTHPLADGNYRIHWQVLASDGHITRGDVDFTVAVK